MVNEAKAPPTATTGFPIIMGLARDTVKLLELNNEIHRIHWEYYTRGFLILDTIIDVLFQVVLKFFMISVIKFGHSSARAVLYTYL